MPKTVNNKAVAALSPGTRLGAYEIVELIGAGGMGKVYRARDAKLGRDVAVKVLPERVAKDRERLRRFEREARLLAQLNHPNVATIHGLEEHDGEPFLVMELVEGETLAERISRERVPLEKAIPLFLQIAEGVEAAHERGIVHRDLKPANVKETPGGRVKVLDFGLAKAFLAADADSSNDADSRAPTLTRGSDVGAIVGTAAYMSPEQARGEPVDKSTDVWALGCCLYEVLTGDRAFAGETVSDTLAKVLATEPNWERLPRATPQKIKWILSRCLTKERSKRLRDVGDLRLLLEDAMTVGPEESDFNARAPAWKRVVPWAVSLAALVLVVVTWRKPAADVGHFVIPTEPLQVENTSAMALSRDGRVLVYVGEERGQRHLFLRPMGSSEARRVSETEGARDPFFSPNGEWIAFFADGKLKKVSTGGGSPIVLTDASAAGGSWRNGTIAFVLPSGEVATVGEDGGTVERQTELDVGRGEFTHAWPELLPDGGALLFTTVDASLGSPHIMLHDLKTGDKTTVIEGARKGRYVSTGHLVYGQEQRLVAVPFDVETRSATGSPVDVLGGVMNRTYQGPQFDVSATGTLVYLRALDETLTQRDLVYVDRSGTKERLFSFSQGAVGPRMSPAAERVAVWLTGTHQVGILDVERQVLSPLSTDAGRGGWPVWSPDGRHIAHVAQSDDGVAIYSRRADGSGEIDVLVDDAHGPSTPWMWSRDGHTLIFMTSNPSTSGHDLWAFDRRDGQRSSILATDANEVHGALSPSGEWLAYASDQSGRWEVYVARFPGGDARRQVSAEGGGEPVWSPDGRELFYRSRDGRQIFAVEVTETESGLQLSPARLLFQGDFRPGVSFGRNIDITPDGKGFLLLEDPSSSLLPTQIYIVVNWFEELEQVVHANPSRSSAGSDTARAIYEPADVGATSSRVQRGPTRGLRKARLGRKSVPYGPQRRATSRSGASGLRASVRPDSKATRAGPFHGRRCRASIPDRCARWRER